MPYLYKRELETLCRSLFKWCEENHYNPDLSLGLGFALANYVRTHWSGARAIPFVKVVEERFPTVVEACEKVGIVLTPTAWAEMLSPEQMVGVAMELLEIEKSLG